MEAKIINESTLTKHDFIEISKAVKRKWSETLYIVCGIIAAAFGLLRLFTINNFEPSIPDAIIFISIGAALLLHPLYSAFFTGSSIYKRQMKLTKGNSLETQILFYEDFFTVKSINGAKTIVNYPNILKDYETKNTYALMTKQNFCIFMKKSSFTRGSLSEARNLISVYCKKS